MRTSLSRLAGRRVHRRAGGEHDGLAVVVELLEQPALEGVGIVHRQGGHQVERALRAVENDAGDLAQLAHERVAALLVLVAHGGKILRADGVEVRGRDLVERGHGKAGLAILERVAQQLPYSW